MQLFSRSNKFYLSQVTVGFINKTIWQLVGLNTIVKILFFIFYIKININISQNNSGNY